jgi:multidrug efflux pump subunit AcrA (membrane-fusion protein)
MKNIFVKAKHFVKKNRWWVLSLSVASAVILFFAFGNKKESVENYLIVSKQDIVEEVSATGNVRPLSNLDLSFEMSGQVSHIRVSPGDKVYQGQVLMSLSNADLVAAVDQAKAGLKIAEANLASIKSGTRPEELVIAKSSVDDAKISLDGKIADAYVKADDAIRNNIDEIFDNPSSPYAKLNIQLNNTVLEYEVNNLRREVEIILNDWEIKGSNLPVSVAYENLDKIKIFLDKLALGINNITVETSNLSQTTLDRYKTAISASRSYISSAYSALNIADSTYNTAKATYDLKLAGNTPETIFIQEATVDQARANLKVAEARLSKSIIYSPISGVVSDVIAKIGEIIQPGMMAVSIISDGKYEIESYIPEADISKISLGQKATTTLDAYGSNTFFDTSVIKISPAETLISGVPTYKVLFKFSSTNDIRIKSGMTANLDILTAERKQVVAVPGRSIYSVDSERFVKLIDPNDENKITEIKVTTGIRGTNGFVEIISGLNEGDKIVASHKI